MPNLPKVVHVTLVNQRYFTLSFCVNSLFLFVCFAPFLNKIWGNNFKLLGNIYEWGYTVCYKVLHMGGWG